MKTLLHCAAVLGFALAGLGGQITAQAQTQMSVEDKEIIAKFKAADKNHDGKLTLAEAQAGMPRVAEHFSYIDSQGRGYVTLDQILALANN